MSRNYLRKMLDMLTGAYNRADVRNEKNGLPLETNIGRLFSTFAWGLEIIHEQSDKILLYDDLDKATGAVLDRYGANFGIERNGAGGEFYRLLIKIKMIALLSGGDIETIINAAVTLFDIEPTDIRLEEVFPAKVWVYIDESALTEEKLEIAALVSNVMKRIAAAGVGFRLFLKNDEKRIEGNIILNTGAAYASETIITPPAPERTFAGALYTSGYACVVVGVTIKPI